MLRGETAGAHDAVAGPTELLHPHGGVGDIGVETAPKVYLVLFLQRKRYRRRQPERILAGVWADNGDENDWYELFSDALYSAARESVAFAGRVAELQEHWREPATRGAAQRRRS